MEVKERSSIVSEQSEPKTEPAGVQIKAVKRKEKFGGMIANDIKDVGTYVWNDVLKPSIKDTLYDIISNGFNRLLYGNDRRRPSSSGRYGDRVSYNRFYERTSIDRPSYTRNTNRDYYYDDDPEMNSNSRYVNAYDIIVGSKGDGEKILYSIESYLANTQKGYITVAKYYEIASDPRNPIRPNPIDFKWGWTDIRNAEVRKDSKYDGYVIIMPRPMPID